jgi:hypothetical protein
MLIMNLRLGYVLILLNLEPQYKPMNIDANTNMLV